MQFTGNSIISLPQVSKFSILLTGILIPDTEPVVLQLNDISGNTFGFTFSGGFIKTNTIIGSYNNIDYNYIAAYGCSGVFNYEINGIYNKQIITFGNLSSLSVNAGTEAVAFSTIVNSNPINYSVSFNPNYFFSGVLTGMISGDTAFNIEDVSLFFYNSNRNLLNNNYTGGLNISTGVNYLSFQDIDNDFIEYQNNFFVSMPTTFGDIGGKFSSIREGITTQNLLSLTDFSTNVYIQTSPFEGFITGVPSGSQFIYNDVATYFDLGYSYGNSNFIGDDLPASLTVNFQALNPQNNTVYNPSYITGALVTHQGLYQYPPNVSFSQYFAITGIQNALQSLLFSTGCNQIPVTFVGGNPIVNASGALILSIVNLSGIYNNGITQFKVVNSYSGINIGSGYTGIPLFVLQTGGSCYSIPDASGFQTAQFKYATGYGAIQNQAAGLTGIPTYFQSGSGYWVTGIQLTNVGFGYNTGSFFPHVYFSRINGDTLTGNDATGKCVFVGTENYYFNSFNDGTGAWSIATNFGTGYVTVPVFNGYSSGTFPTLGQGNMNILILFSGFDNTTPISGLLTLNLANGVNSITVQDTIIQSRTFDLSTGAFV